MNKILILNLIFAIVALFSSAFAQNFEFTPQFGGQINGGL